MSERASLRNDRRQWLTHGPMIAFVFVLVRWGREVFAASLVGSWVCWIAGVEPLGEALAVIAVVVSAFRFGVVIGSAIGPDGIRALERKT